MVAPLWLVSLVLALQVPPPPSGAPPGSGLRHERRALREEETAQLRALAARLREGGDASAATEVLAKVEPAPAPDGATRFVPLPEVVPPTATNGLANVPAEREPSPSWRAELRTIRTATANALFDLAGRAAALIPAQYDVADECLRSILVRLPDHPEARRLLGYVPHEGGWATPYAVRKLKGGWVFHPVYGWVEASWVPHLERGELPAPLAKGQRLRHWLPAEEADRLHAPWENAWEISTEHFQIRTNVPLAEAIAFGRRLEGFHDLFTALLADVIALGIRLPLAQRYQDKAMVGEKASEPHQVFYFAAKQEYVDHLLPTQGPEIEQSLGLYVPPKPGKGKRAPAYFFRDPEGQIDATATLYHEVSHQLLFELAGPNAFDRNVGNYWVFEGLGTYFETVLPQPDGSLQVGGLVGPRIEQAQLRLIQNREFIPTARLVQLSQHEFNRREAVYLNYAEAMALAVFLMQGRDQEYREPFLDYVKDAYRGRLKRETGRPLNDRLGVPYKTLDAQFLQFLDRG